MLRRWVVISSSSNTLVCVRFRLVVTISFKQTFNPSAAPLRKSKRSVLLEPSSGCAKFRFVLFYYRGLVDLLLWVNYTVGISLSVAEGLRRRHRLLMDRGARDLGRRLTLVEARLVDKRVSRGDFL